MIQKTTLPGIYCLTRIIFVKIFYQRAFLKLRCSKTSHGHAIKIRGKLLYLTIKNSTKYNHATTRNKKTASGTGQF